MNALPLHGVAQENRRATMERAKGLTPALLQFLEERANVTVYVEPMAAVLPYTERQITQGMWHIMKKEQLPGLEKIAHGVWRYSPEKSAAISDRLTVTFEVLKETDDAYVLMDDMGNVYKAVMLA
jgi:hypothetical protein